MSFQQNVKTRLNFKKNVKYVFSNNGSQSAAAGHQGTVAHVFGAVSAPPV